MAVLIAEQLPIARLRADDRAGESDGATRRLRFLLKVSQQLALAREPSAVLQSLVDQAVPELGDAAIVHLAGTGRRQRRAALTSSTAFGGGSRDWWEWI